MEQLSGVNAFDFQLFHVVYKLPNTCVKNNEIHAQPFTGKKDLLGHSLSWLFKVTHRRTICFHVDSHGT